MKKIMTSEEVFPSLRGLLDGLLGGARVCLEKARNQDRDQTAKFGREEYQLNGKEFEKIGRQMEIAGNFLVKHKMKEPDKHRNIINDLSKSGGIVIQYHYGFEDDELCLYAGVKMMACYPQGKPEVTVETVDEWLENAQENQKFFCRQKCDTTHYLYIQYQLNMETAEWNPLEQNASVPSTEKFEKRYLST